MIDVAERRARLVQRHRLAADDVPTITEVADSVVALHATDPATVHLSAAARAPGVTVADIERVLYDEHRLVRLMGMRRTLFVADPGLAPVIHASSTRKIAATEHRRLLKMLTEGEVGLPDPEAFIAEVKAKVLAALHDHGEASGRDLSSLVPELQQKIELSPGKSYGGTTSITSQILSRMTMDGSIVRQRPLGTWLSGQFRYAPMADLIPDIDRLTTAEASVDLLRRYLAAFGPATFTDCVWWTGWTKTQTRAALDAVGPVEVEVDGGIALVLADDIAPPDGTGTETPSVALLPSLDPTIMGWKERDWYLGAHGQALFDTFGNAGPTIVVDGRVVGGWGQRPDGTVVHRFMDDVGTEVAALVEAEADRLTAWLGGTVVSPSFRTPLEKELAA